MVLIGTPTYEHLVYRRGGNAEDVHKPVAITRGFWLGGGAIILAKLGMDEGCNTEAGAVLTRSTEANALYLDNPVMRVKELPVDPGSVIRNLN